MLRVDHDSLVAAADDLDLAVAGVAAGILDPGACGGLGIDAAWSPFAHAWASAIGDLADTQHRLADGVRRVAEAALVSDQAAARVIAQALP